MNSKYAGGQPESCRPTGNEVVESSANKTVLVGEKAHFVGFPFTKGAEIKVSTAMSNNQVLAFPTETYYGLGGNAFQQA